MKAGSQVPVHTQSQRPSGRSGSESCIGEKTVESSRLVLETGQGGQGGLSYLPSQVAAAAIDRAPVPHHLAVAAMASRARVDAQPSILAWRCNGGGALRLVTSGISVF
jgi:hypothetical protein